MLCISLYTVVHKNVHALTESERKTNANIMCLSNLIFLSPNFHENVHDFRSPLFFFQDAGYIHASMEWTRVVISVACSVGLLLSQITVDVDKTFYVCYVLGSL